MAASRLFVCTESGASRGLGEDIPGPARHKLCPSSLQAELSQARPEADDEALAKAFETAFAATPAWFIKQENEGPITCQAITFFLQLEID